MNVDKPQNFYTRRKSTVSVNYKMIQNVPSPKSGGCNCISLQALRLSNKMVLADPAQVLVRRSKNSAGMFLAVSCIKISYNPLQHQILDDDLVNFPQGSWREHLGQFFLHVLVERACGCVILYRSVLGAIDEALLESSSLFFSHKHFHKTSDKIFMYHWDFQE